MKSAGSWERIFFEWKTNFVRYRSGSLEVRTLVQLEPKLSIILNDAYWEDLCICEVNRVLGAEGLASIITIWLFARDSTDTSRLTGYPDPR